MLQPVVLASGTMIVLGLVVGRCLIGDLRGGCVGWRSIHPAKDESKIARKRDFSHSVILAPPVNHSAKPIGSVARLASHMSPTIVHA